jgi:hypothetical protein
LWLHMVLGSTFIDTAMHQFMELKREHVRVAVTGDIAAARAVLTMESTHAKETYLLDRRQELGRPWTNQSQEGTTTLYAQRPASYSTSAA